MNSTQMTLIGQMTTDLFLICVNPLYLCHLRAIINY